MLQKFEPGMGGGKTTSGGWTPSGHVTAVPCPIATSATFSEFLYRLWIENEIWFAEDEDRPLTSEQQRYAEHYVR